MLIDEVVGPAMASTGLDPAAIQLLRSPGRQTAFALVREPALIPLVILRGSGESTRALAREAALHGVRTLAHADGGAVIYLDSSADRKLALQLIETSLDRLGVCNRLNLLLVHGEIWEAMVPLVTELAERIGVAVSLPPHQHRLGLEWALEAGSEATITVAPAAGATDAADIANTETSRTGRRRRGRGCRRGRPVPGRLRRHRRVLERLSPAAGRVQAALDCRRRASTSMPCPGRAGR